MKFNRRKMAGLLSVTLAMSAILPAQAMAEEETVIMIDDEVLDDTSDELVFDEIAEDFFEEDMEDETGDIFEDETIAETKEDEDSLKESEEMIAEEESEENETFEAANPYGNTVEGFVYRLYTCVLNRSPETTGFNYWVNALKSGKRTGAQAAAEFVQSNEFKNKKVSDSEYLEILYNTFLGRKSDASGKSYWQKKMDLGMSRDYVLNGFVNSNEFNRICRSFGIQKGQMVLTEPRDMNEGVTMFIARCYEKCLSRKADANGLNYWCQQLLKGRMTAKDVAYGFFDSDEMTRKDLSLRGAITLFYQVMMGRNPDTAGMNYWISQAERGISMEDIFYQFADSPEFRKLVGSYGIDNSWSASPVARIFDGGTFTLIIPASWDGKYYVGTSTSNNGDTFFSFCEKNNYDYYRKHKDDGVIYNQGYCESGLLICIGKHKGALSSRDIHNMTSMGWPYYGYKNGYSYYISYNTGVPYNGYIPGMTEPFMALWSDKYLLEESFMFK